MAAVRIENEAWGDPRYAVLATLCGLTSPLFALVLCARVWSHCTDRNEDVVSAQLLDALSGVVDFGAKMRDAELAEKLRSGFRIRGAKGRIEWLDNKKKAGAKGGQSRAAGAQAQLKHNSSTTSTLLEHSLADPPSTTQASAPALLCSAPARENESESAPAIVIPFAERRATEPWLRVWQLFEQVTQKVQGSPGANRSALEAIAAVSADRAGSFGEHFDATTERCLRGWLADPWVARTRPPLSNLAKDPGKYLDAPPTPPEAASAAPYHEEWRP